MGGVDFTRATFNDLSKQKEMGPRMSQDVFPSGFRRALLGAITASGFTSMLAQILLIRELLVVFEGLEMSVGILLASWMFLVAIGSWLAGRGVVPLRLGPGTLLASQWLLAVLIPAAIFGARLLKAALGLAVYEVVDLATMTWATLVLLAPICLLVGFQFALLSHLLAARKDGAVGELSWVYLCETLGALLGGLLFSYLLVFVWEPLSVAWLASLCNLGAAGMILGTARTGWGKGRRYWGLAGQFLVSGAWLVAVRQGPALEQAVARKQWGEFHLVETHYSRYGHLAVTEQAEQYTFYENGLSLFSLPAILTPEELAHYSLLQHRQPREVLLIGGGISGLVQEVLRHKVQRVCYVELDPQIITTAQKYLSPEDRRALADSRVEVFLNLDGRLFVKRTRQPFDVILVCLPDPSTAQLNRFYTLEFCREARQALRGEGVLALRLSSGENYLSPETQLLNACLDRTLRQVFADVVVLPGETALFLACPSPGRLTTQPEVLAARFRQRGLKPKYLTEYDFTLRMMPERMEWLRDSMNKASQVKLNRDFFPICYYYDWLRWAAQFSQRDEASARRAKRLLALATEARVEWFVLPLAIVGIGRRLMRRRPFRIPRRMVAWTLFCSGFSGMALEMLLVFAFQSLYGYVYYQVGLLITAFMLGLFLGAYRMHRILAGSPAVGPATLARLQLVFTLYALLLPLTLGALAPLMQRTLLFLAAQVIFPLLVASTGVLVGLQFPLASSICLQAEGAVAGRVGGSLYAADLLGACSGAFLVSAFFLPLLGVAQTCLGTALLMASAVVGLGLREPLP